MRLKMLAVAACLSIFFFAAGCPGLWEDTGQNNTNGSRNISSSYFRVPPVPNESPGGPRNQTTPENSSERQLRPTAQCNLSLVPSVIYAGGETEVKYEVYSGVGTTFSFNCGKDEKQISTGGLVKGSTFCKFDKVGEQKIRIRANNAICAEASLLVLSLPPDERRCWIDQASIKRDLKDYYYQATVHWENFQKSATLIWTCDYTTTKRRYYEAPGVGLQKMETISCDFSERPKKDYITVYVDDVICGEIPTR
ncbi:MAG: hypothetical protein N3G22_04830 [Candidatus Micrarchaeota archaeon]|nr:hypothetical protein [Candidatus Micrarchaeota archaeon]